VQALAVRWVLDQGPTIALWGARSPQQLDPLGEIEGWHLDAETRAAIDSILEQYMRDRVSPEFMAPPERSGASDPHLAPG
jgi:aryl-alcohol dehydrogenase-like predicted oxidoreductase